MRLSYADCLPDYDCNPNRECLAMYLNKCPFSFAQGAAMSKCNKIFRPWDSEGNPMQMNAGAERLDDAQDATISTTTENEDAKLTPEDTPKIVEETCSKGFKKLKEDCQKRLHHRNFPENIEPPPPPPDYPGNLEGYPLYPEFVHVNLAQSLGLAPTDPLFLECLNQGCTLEEYSRVMSQEQQAKILSARKQRPKKYRCPHCDVGFSNNGQLKGHIRIHTGERPFRCDENNCGKTFTRNEELTRHKRIHSGLRPFPCSHCGKRFGRKDHLKKHSRTHFQPRGLYAVPVMLPFETWTSPAYPYVPMFTY